jgi:predicted XRE-type DNA-binding protein
MSAGTKTKSKAGGARAVVREGSGNVFEDLRVPDSSEALAKAELASQVVSAIVARGLTQARAAKLLQVDQADVSDLVRGKLKGFSTDRLLRLLNRLGRDIEIVVRVRSGARRFGRLRVLGGRIKRAVARK